MPLRGEERKADPPATLGMTRGGERSLDCARDDNLRKVLVDEGEAVGDELGEDVGVEHDDDADDGG